MTRGVAVSLALLALIALALIVLLAWPTHSASDSPVGTDDLAGMVNPDVTQANIGETICRRGWAATVRPPATETDAIKRKMLAQLPPGVREKSPDYELDYIIPLDLGGAPLDRRNLALQRRRGSCNAKQKDELVRRLSIMVCAGDVTLTRAQHEIATDWRAAYQKWIDGKGCGEP
jgi:hypothetical protein